MNVAVVSCVYPPEPVVSSRTSADVAAALRAAGDDVTVICPFPSRGVADSTLRRRWRATSDERGITIIRCFSIFSRASTLVSRFAENVSFGITSSLALLRVRKPDVIYMNSWPIVATGLAALVARMRGVPYVVSVQDVYPESLVVQGRAGARAIAFVLRAIDRWIARRAKAMIVLSGGFAAIYREDRGVPRERIHIVPNWLPRDSVSSSDSREIRARFGVRDDDVLVVYAGNIGVAAGVEQLVEEFVKIGDPRIHLLIAGDGARADAVERLARERVHILRPWKDENVMGAADILALPTFGEQSVISVPSKLIAYLLAGKPVIAAVSPKSEVARILSESGAGWSVTMEELAPAIVRMAAEDRTAYGARGREYALEHFTTESSVPRVLEVLHSVSSLAPLGMTTMAKIRAMTAGDVNSVTDVHLAAFPGFFLTFLGRGFLRQLYRGIVDDPSGIAYVAEHDGEIAGFVAGTAIPARFYSRLLRRRFLPFAWHSGLAVLRRPSAIPRVLRAFTKSSDAPPAATGRAEMMSLAVLPAQSGGGLGARLVEAFNAGAAARGAKTVFLTTDAANNESVNRFYVRSGFTLARTFTTPEGRAMNEYERSLA